MRVFAPTEGTPNIYIDCVRPTPSKNGQMGRRPFRRRFRPFESKDRRVDVNRTRTCVDAFRVLGMSILCSASPAPPSAQ